MVSFGTLLIVVVGSVGWLQLDVACGLVCAAGCGSLV